MLTNDEYLKVAKFLGCEVAVVKAVKAVEAPMGGFDDSGRLIMLFEPHVFWKELRKIGYTLEQLNKLMLNYPALVSPVWNPKLYPAVKRKANKSIDWVATMDLRYAILEEAKKVHTEAALMACSWGAFQILGNNYKAAGYDNVFAMCRGFERGEGVQLSGFASYVKANRLDDELRAKDWKGFARGYNGPEYWKNKYDVLLNNAYLKYK
jgi:hypothetical protein